MTTAVLIPVKSFDDAKGRLANAVGPAERAALARSMASIVVKAAAPLPVFVVCDDHAVAAWAIGSRASVLWRPANGLNSAVTQARDALRREGFSRLIIAHGDLPFATDLAWVDQSRGVTIMTDRRSDGTNVMALPTEPDFVFAYGSRSAENHAVEASRLGLVSQTLHDDRLGWDVDVPEDLPSATNEPRPVSTCPGQS